MGEQEQLKNLIFVEAAFDILGSDDYNHLIEYAEKLAKEYKNENTYRNRKNA